MNPWIDIYFIALFTALSCALPGNFLVIRKMSMVTDAVSHTVLLGIVIGFFLAGTLTSPWLIMGAAATGVLTVWMIETLQKKKHLAPDAAIGLVFPFLFSVAVILITKYAGNVHLDTDCVLFGELAFAPFHRVLIGNMDFGATAMYTGASTLLVVGGAILLFFKEISLTAFDDLFADVAGFSPSAVHYGTMTLVSLAAVTAFQTVGTVLVIAFMIAPAMTASLWTQTLKARIVLSLLIATIAVTVGIPLALATDTALAGMMATVLGVLFLLSLLLSPKGIRKKNHLQTA